MTFQYFFFNTVPGYFLQALPFALAVGVWYALRLHKKEPRLSPSRVLLRSLFPCYLTGLLIFTVFLFSISSLYHLLFYGRLDSFHAWFIMDYDFHFDFFQHFTTENRDNILLFLPFGILYPLYRPKAGWGRTVLAGLCTTVAIELVQPIVGRSFDVDDILMNLFGTVASATLYFLLRAVLFPKKKSA